MDEFSGGCSGLGCSFISFLLHTCILDVVLGMERLSMSSSSLDPQSKSWSLSLSEANLYLYTSVVAEVKAVVIVDLQCLTQPRPPSDPPPLSLAPTPSHCDC